MKKLPRTSLRKLTAVLLLASLTTGCIFYDAPLMQADVPSTAAPIYDFIRIGPTRPTDAPQPTTQVKVVPVATPKPTAAPKPSKRPATTRSVKGTATYYCCTHGYPSGMYAAAGSEIRIGAWRGRYVSVCAAGCIRVRLVDWCACKGNRIIDLYPEAFSRLGKLSRGVIPVTVRW